MRNSRRKGSLVKRTGIWALKLVGNYSEDVDGSKRE